MRICTLVNAYLPNTGGIEILVDATSQPLLRSGHELLIITGDGDSRDKAACSDQEWLQPSPGVQIHRLNAFNPVNSRDVRGIHRLHKELQQILDEFQPDIVHAHDVGPLLWFYERVARRSTRRPLVVTLHTMMTKYEELTPEAVQATGGLLRNADIVTGVSQQVVGDVLEFAPDVADRIEHLPNGIVAPCVPTVPIDRNRVTYIGRLVPYKDADLAIDAIEITHRRNSLTRLDIFGEGPLANSLEAQIASSGLDDVVSLRGRRSHDETLNALAASSCLLMSSQFEGLPLVALEAAWCGRPVVAFDVPGVNEAVIDGETGVLVPPGDVRALGEAIADLIADPDRSDRLGANGRERAEREFTIDRYVAELLELFDRTIKKIAEETALA